MRNIINKFGVPISIIVIVVAAVFTWLSHRTTRIDVGDPSLAYFFNEETGEESILPSDQIPPIPDPSGKGSLVIAAKFKGESDKAPKTYYLIKYTDEVRAKIESLPSDDVTRQNLLSAAQLVRSPDHGSPWVSISDERADRIVSVPEWAPNRPRIRVSPPRAR